VVRRKAGKEEFLGRDYAMGEGRKGVS